MIAAAGSGSRLGAGGPKALVDVAGRPLVWWCFAAFEAAESVGPVVVAAPPGHEDEIAAVAPGATVVAGSDSRSASVAAALTLVQTELVAVHDAARPLITPELIDATVARLLADPDAAGAIAAARVADTLKRSADGVVIDATEDRASLWAAQTPQVFRTESLREAHAADPALVATASDDAMLVERLGGTMLIEPAPAANLKVTTADDLDLAEALLRER